MEHEFGLSKGHKVWVSIQHLGYINIIRAANHLLTDKDEVFDAYSDYRITEEIITGEEAIRFRDLLENPPDDPERISIIEEAIRKFPEPNKPTEIDIKMADE